MNKSVCALPKKWLWLIVVAVLLILLFFLTIRYLYNLTYEHVPSETLVNARIKTHFNNIEAALDVFFLDNLRYPSELEGLDILVRGNDISKYPGVIRKVFLKDINLRDPWGIPFQYSVNERGIGYVIESLGKDNTPGGDGLNRDHRRVVNN